MTTDSVIWNVDDPLARCKRESLNALSALVDYEAMGPGRSLRLLSKGYRGELPSDHILYSYFAKYVRSDDVYGTVPPTLQKATLGRWSSRFDWQARISRLEEIRKNEREVVRRQRAWEVEDKDWEQGQALRDKVQALLVEMERFETVRVQEVVDANGDTVRIVTVKFKPTLNQMSGALKIGSELQRLSAGMATSNQRLVDRQGDDRDIPVIGIEVVNPNL